MDDHTANDNQRVIEAAIAYAKLGWRVVPVLGKVPIGGKGWQHLATSDAGEAAATFEGTVADGVGVLLHASGLIDLDADSPEAEAAIQAVFEGNIPRTPSFQSTRGIHRLFRWRDGWPQQANVAKWMAGPIEVRGISTKAAAQTVFPPSGERRWLVPFTEPVAELTDEILERLTRLAHTSKPPRKPPRKPTALIVPRANDNNRVDVPRYLNRVGARVLRQDRTEDGADRWFIECPRLSAHSQRDGEKDCCVTQKPDGTLGGHCFHTSCGMSGWQAIRDALGALTADDFDNTPSVNLSGLIAKMERGGTVAVIDEPDDEPDDELGDIVTAADFPKQCLEPEGLLGEFIDYTLDNSVKPQPELALACAIAVVATFAGRKVCDARGTRTNVYLIGLAETGEGKEAAREAAKTIINRVASHLLGCERIGSGAGIVTAICAQPSHLMLLDEVGRMLEVCKNPAKNPAMYNAVSVLMQLFSSAKNTFTADAYADASRVKSVCQPCLCIYGTSTPKKFWDSFTMDSISDGFLGRVMAFEGREFPMRRDFRQTPPPDDLLDALRWWADWQPSDNPAAVITPQPRVLEYSEEAHIRFVTHENAIDDKRRTESRMHANLWARTAEKTAKLALIHAVSRTRTNPQTIEIEDVEFAIAISNFLTRRMIANCQQWMSDNEHEANTKKVLRIIDGCGRDGITGKELQRKTQWLKARDRTEIINHLAETGQIVSEERATKTRPATVWRTKHHRVTASKTPCTILHYSTGSQNASPVEG